MSYIIYMYIIYIIHVSSSLGWDLAVLVLCLHIFTFWTIVQIPGGLRPSWRRSCALEETKKNRGRWTYGESMVIHVKSRKFWKMQKQLKHWRHIESSSRHSQSGINHEIPSRTMALEADVHRNLMKTQSLKTELVASESFSGLDLLTRTCFIPTCWIHDSGKLLERFLFICLTLFWLLY